MIDDAGQEIELGMWYRLLEEKQDLLAEVKQIHEILREAFTTDPKHSGAEYLNMIARVTGLIK